MSEDVRQRIASVLAYIGHLRLGPDRETQMTDSDDQCRVVEVDGEPIRVRADRDLTEKDREMLAEVARAAKRKLAEDNLT